MSFNLAVILRESSNAHPDKPLCHLGEQTFSYAQVDELSGRIATSCVPWACVAVTRWRCTYPTCPISCSPTSAF